ncbi:MAG: Biopolymer transport protein [Myxococcaceae bacterium]|nr:Biopolymer transport protein [Myxococcaceae bacterium]
MAGAVVEGPSGGRRQVDSPINMIPMIDLLASMIAFLLMTAVWVEVGAVRATQPVSRPADAPAVDPAPHLTLMVSTDAVRVGETAADAATLAGRAGRVRRLSEALRLRHAADPHLRLVRIQSDGAVPYQDVIEVMDAVYSVWGDGLAPGRRASDAVTIEFS